MATTIARHSCNPIFLHKEAKPRTVFIATERKFKLRLRAPEFFTEGNEGNEGGPDPSKIQSLFSSLSSV